MSTITSISFAIDKIYRHYGTESLEEAMNSIYAEIVHFEHINWLPILEVCVMQNYLPDNILDISMNYFLWKGDMKKSAELARLLRLWRNKGLNDLILQKKLLPLKDLILEFSIIEERDKMRTIFTRSVDKETFNYNSSYLYAGLKSLYYSGILQNIMLLRIYYCNNILKYRQIWEFGIRKLKNFTRYNPGITQEWINVYFSVAGNNFTDENLLINILPVNPNFIERKRDLFLVIGFNNFNGRIRSMVLFRNNGDNKSPSIIWKDKMLIN